MKKRLLTMVMLFVMAMVSIPCIGEWTGGNFGMVEAEAATAYKELSWFSYGKEGKWEKVGKNYFTCLDGKIWYKNNLSSTAKRVPFKGDINEIITNGTYVYAIENLYDVNEARLSCYNIGDDQIKVIKTFSTEDYSGVRFYKIHKNTIIIQKSAYVSGYDHVYTYSLATKSLKKAVSKCNIEKFKGQYFLGLNSASSSPRYSLYKIAKSGKITKIKTLGTYATFVGKKVYYSQISKVTNTKSKVSIYSCNLNGSKKKTIGSFTITHAKGAYNIGVYELTSKYCEGWYYKPYYKETVDEWGFKYTYKNKALKLNILLD